MMPSLEEKTTMNGQVHDLTLRDLPPAPGDLWQKMMGFSGPAAEERAAMVQTVDVLFQRGYELVVATYDHLRNVPDTAEILGWEHGVDEAHLAERRRFLTIWLARTISMDFGTDFAGYLYHAGRVHAAHGPRRIHTPPMWVTGSMGLVLGAFAGFIKDAHPDTAVSAPALAGWNKYLMMQLNQMNTGYSAALALHDGEERIDIKAYGLARLKWGRDAITAYYRQGETVSGLLARLVTYAPALREMMFEQAWHAEDSDKDLWMRVVPVYALRGNWRVLLNGKDLRYHGGFGTELTPGDVLDLFPPGR